MAIEFVDPRAAPAPPWRGTRRPLAAAPDEVAPLLQAIARGRVYEAEAWVRAGGPIQFATPKVRPWTKQSPLEVALRHGAHDAALLLLCNGYDPLLERYCPVTLALRPKRVDLLDLVLAWGADPKRADARTALAVHDVALLERLWRLGVDLTRGDALAHAVAYSTTNRQLYGFLKRHAHEDAALQAALNRGLCTALDRREVKEKAVNLCVWAGADPWAFVPEPWDRQNEETASEGWRLYRSAVGKAVSMKKSELLRAMKVSGKHPRFQDLYDLVHDVGTFDALAALAPPRDATALARRALGMFGVGPYNSSWEGEHLLERALAAGACVQDVSEYTCKSLQKFLGSERYTVVASPRKLLRLLQDPAHMVETAFLKVIASPRVLDQAQSLGIRRVHLEALAASTSVKKAVGTAARRAIRKNRRRRWWNEEAAAGSGP